MFRFILALGLAFAAAAPAVRASSLSLAAASDLVYCLEELNAAFAKAHPDIAIKTSTGSSGNFFAQIKNGAPFDLFLSADLVYPRELIKAGLADGASLTPYAVGRIVVWTAKDGVDVSAGLAALAGPAVRRVAIANPDHAPYGRAAQGALESAKLWDAVQAKLVHGENISQTAQFVETGNADAGIVALSLVLSPKLKKKGRWVVVPEKLYPPLEQGAVLTAKGADNPAARSYLEFLRSAAAREIFDRFGFRLPG